MKARFLLEIVLCLVPLRPIYACQAAPPPATQPAAENRAPAQPMSAFEQTLLDAERGLFMAFKNKDLQYFRNTVADDFLAIGSNGDVYGKSELLASLRHGEGGETGPEPTLYDFKVVPLNENAGVVAYNIIVPGAHPRYQHMSTTWVKQNGQWKVKFEQSTPNQWSASDFD